MLRKILLVVFVTVALGISSPLWSYDTDAAGSYNELFSTVKGAASGKNLHLVPAEKFVEKIKKQEPVVVVDVRTPKELSIIGVTLPGTLNIPLNELFQAETLNSIPTDKPVFIVCQSGVRSTAAGTALRHIGFKNVYIVKGGLKALINYLGPKQAYAPVKTNTK